MFTGLFGTQWWETLVPIAFNMYCNLESTHELEQLSASLIRDDIPPLRQIIALEFEAVVILVVNVQVHAKCVAVKDWKAFIAELLATAQHGRVHGAIILALSMAEVL